MSKGEGCIVLVLGAMALAAFVFFLVVAMGG